MDFRKFFKLLYKRRILLVSIPVLTIIITYFLTRSLPDTFVSRARLGTGIVDQSQNVFNQNDEQESKISQEFSNLTQMMLLNKIVDQVSYKLIIHDLSDPKPYKQPSKLLRELSAEAKKHAVDVFKQHYQQRKELSLFIPDEQGLHKVLESMGYDDESLRKKLAVYRVNNSDFIDVECTAESPELAAVVVNSLCQEFVTYYTSIVKENQIKAVNFYERLMREKQDSMNKAMADLKNYKIHNHVLNLNEQAKSLYGQFADFETRRALLQKDIASYTIAIRDIDNRFNPQEKKYLEASLVKINGDIIDYKAQLNDLNDKYIASNFDEKYKTQIDGVKEQMNKAIIQSSDKYLLSPLTTRQELVTQKLQMEVQLDLAKNSVNGINAEIDRLNRKFDELVPHEAEVQAFENDIDVASREYLEMLAKYNQTSLASNFSINLRQIQEGMPGTVQPSKKMLLVILSGMISFVFCIVVLFVLFYLDRSATLPKEVVAQTNMPVLGVIKTVKGSGVDIKDIWQSSATKDAVRFRDELRATRFEIDQEMGDANKILAITSLINGEGKTFIAISLAYAYAMANKKVLLIDGNFNNPSITDIIKPSFFVEDYLTKNMALPAAGANAIQVLGNRGGGASLLEIAPKQTVTEKLQALTNSFDIILVETASLKEMDKAREWMQFSDKTVAVFERGKTINEAKKNNVAYLQSIGSRFAGWVFNRAE